ncbi:MAG: hypothetical protein EA379_02845 [Phycisphaerales bacterium]|nr:MAG: hypothetical protein EA379_02845 [Phycisphaerales bacterium]
MQLRHRTHPPTPVSEQRHPHISLRALHRRVRIRSFAFSLAAVALWVTMLVIFSGCQNTGATIGAAGAESRGAGDGYATFYWDGDKWVGRMPDKFSLGMAGADGVDVATPGLLTMLTVTESGQHFASSGDVQGSDIELALSTGETLTIGTFSISASDVVTAGLPAQVALYNVVREMSADDREKFVRFMESVDLVTPEIIGGLKAAFGIP